MLLALHLPERSSRPVASTRVQPLILYEHTTFTLLLAGFGYSEVQLSKFTFDATRIQNYCSMTIFSKIVELFFDIVQFKISMAKRKEIITFVNLCKSDTTKRRFSKTTRRFARLKRRVIFPTRRFASAHTKYGLLQKEIWAFVIAVSVFVRTFAKQLLYDLEQCRDGFDEIQSVCRKGVCLV